MNSSALSSQMDRALLISIRVVLALVLLAPLIVMTSHFGGYLNFLPHTFFPFIVGKALYTRALIEIAVGLWVVLALRDPSYRDHRSWLLVIFAGYVFVVLLSALFGVSPQRSMWSTYERMEGFVAIAHWLLFIWVLTSVFRSWGDWRWLLNFNLGVSVLMGLLGLSQHFEVGVLDFLRATPRLDITLGNPTYVGAYMLVNVVIALGFLAHSYLRPAGPPPTPAQQRRRKRAMRRKVGREAIFSEFWWGADWMAVFLLSVLILFLVGAGSGFTGVAFAGLVIVVAAFAGSYVISERQRHAWWRVFWMLTLGLDFSILYLSGTRGAVVGLAAGLVAFAVGYVIWGQNRRIKLASIVLVGSLFGLAVVMVTVRNTTVFQTLAESNLMLRRIANTNLGDDSFKGRINSGLVGLRAFAARPVLGWGPENFTIAYDRYVTADIVAEGVTSFDQAHNKLIEELTTKGFLGFAGYVAIWLYMLWIVARRVRQQSSQTQIFTLFAGAALTGYFVQNLFLFDTPGTVGQFYLLMGFMVYVDTRPVASADAGQAPAAAEPEIGSSGFWRSGILRSDGSAAIALGVVAVLVSVTIYFANYGPYSGAATVLRSRDPSITAEERLEIFDEAIGAFPALANYFRIIMFNQLTQRWSELNAQEAQAALDAAASEGKDAQQGEPEEWRVYLPLAALYQRAAASDSDLVQRARVLVDRAAELAPNRIEVVQMVVRQHIAEQDYDGALETIDVYVLKNAAADRHFAALKRQIDAATAE